MEARYESFIARARARFPGLVIDDQNEEVIEQLYYFFTIDQRFNGDLQKGICLAGPVGTGKTFIMKLFIDFMNDATHFYKIKSSISAVEEFLTLGIRGIDYIFGPRSKYGYCFDDIGCEPFESAYMGNRVGVMSFLITKRYETGGPFRNIFFTSNLGKSQLEDAYGTRVKSRLTEMVNFIHLLGNDRRK
jgi:DNA replication protein DnaC